MSEKNNVTPFTALVIVLLVVSICLFVLYAILRDYPIIAYGDNGVWDLSGRSMEDGFYRLAGPVEYIPGALLTPNEFAEREDEALVGNPEDVSQYATSRMRIIMPDNAYYIFTGRSIDYAERLYVNGEWVLDVGRPGETKESMVPDTGKVTLTLRPVDGVIELIQQGSIFVHREGGGHAGWQVSAAALARVSLIDDLTEGVRSGCFLALFFVHLILFMLLRSYRANLYFALFCLMWFLRLGVTGAKIFTDLFPWMPWELKFRLEYLTFPVTATLLISLLNILFPQVLHRPFRLALYGVSAAVAAIFLVSDTVFMSHALLWCEAVYIPAILYIVARFVMKLRSVNVEQGVFLVGVGLFFYASVHDMLYHNDVVFFPEADLSSVSMLLLTFCEAAAVFIATVREVEKAKNQERFLAVENATLKEHARMAERQIALQSEQYELLTDNITKARTARHDMRHLLLAIKGYLGAEDEDGARQYIDELYNGIPADYERMICENFAVNAIALHYEAIAKGENIRLSLNLDIPQQAGRVEDKDLCIIVGNLLENGIEACRRVDGGSYIKLNSYVRNDYIAIVMDNSANGRLERKGGAYASSKRAGDGIGLYSIETIARKYDGTADFEVKDGVFLSSVVINMAGYIDTENAVDGAAALNA